MYQQVEKKELFLDCKRFKFNPVEHVFHPIYTINFRLVKSLVIKLFKWVFSLKL